MVEKGRSTYMLTRQAACRTHARLLDR